MKVCNKNILKYKTIKIKHLRFEVFYFGKNKTLLVFSLVYEDGYNFG